MTTKGGMCRDAIKRRIGKPDHVRDLETRHETRVGSAPLSSFERSAVSAARIYPAGLPRPCIRVETRHSLCEWLLLAPMPALRRAAQTHRPPRPKRRRPEGSGGGW